MATSTVVEWTVLIVVEEDANLTGTYRMSPNMKLSEVMQIWRDDFQLFGYWVFKSTNEEIVYDDDSMTLELIGPSVSHARIITLKAELSDQPTQTLINEIFVCLKDRCHHLFVNPHEKLFEVMRRLPGEPKYLEYTGFPLNPKNTIKQTGLQNQSIIYESTHSLAVQMSTGYTKVFQMPTDSLVLNLKEKIRFYETDDFSLTYQGRLLKSDETVRQLQHPVVVTTAEFLVIVDGRHVRWRTKDEPIQVSTFVAELSAKGNIDAHKLEELEFVCVGCQRRICNSKDYIQQMPVECCRERSLTLNAIGPSDARTNAETNDVAKQIQAFHEPLIHWRADDLRTDGARYACRQMKEKLTENRLDYNVIIQSSEKLMGKIIELKDKLRELEVNLKTLKTKNIESKKTIERLQTTNLKDMKDMEILKKENKKLKEEIDEWYEEIGVKLLVLYSPGVFSSVPRPEVQSQGQWPCNPKLSYIKCQIPGIRAGSIRFKQLRDALQQFFTGQKIQRIGQCCGSVAERGVAMVTLQDVDEAMETNESPYCDTDGAQYSYEEAKPSFQSIHAGGHVIICGRRRRTVLVF